MFILTAQNGMGVGMPRYHLALLCVPGIGAMSAGKILAAFPEVERAFGASVARLRELGLSERQAEALASFSDFARVECMEEQIAASGQHVLAFSDPNYPAALRTLFSPPPVVFVRGDISIKAELSASVVGTRHPTPYGLKVAEHLGAALSRSGICTISGGARGIDAQAHRGAMAAGGPTVAVLGAGLDVPYPPEHVTFFEQIVAEGGALLGELPPGTPPMRGNFPARNRLLAGLGRACVVVEAGDKSGALITARYAMEQGKTVLAVPGRIDRAQSRGVNRLIRDGAKPLLEILDVVEEVLGEHLNRGQAEDEAATAMRAQLPPPPGDAGKIWSRLVDAETDADELVVKTGLSAAQVNAALLELELAGRVQRLPGNRYAVTQED